MTWLRKRNCVVSKCTLTLTKSYHVWIWAHFRQTITVKTSILKSKCHLSKSWFHHRSPLGFGRNPKILRSAASDVLHVLKTGKRAFSRTEQTKNKHQGAPLKRKKKKNMTSVLEIVPGVFVLSTPLPRVYNQVACCIFCTRRSRSIKKPRF